MALFQSVQVLVVLSSLHLISDCDHDSSKLTTVMEHNRVIVYELDLFLAIVVRNHSRVGTIQLQKNLAKNRRVNHQARKVKRHILTSF